MKQRKSKQTRKFWFCGTRQLANVTSFHVLQKPRTRRTPLTAQFGGLRNRARIDLFVLDVDAMGFRRDFLYDAHGRTRNR